MKSERGAFSMIALPMIFLFFMGMGIAIFNQSSSVITSATPSMETRRSYSYDDED